MVTVDFNKILDIGLGKESDVNLLTATKENRGVPKVIAVRSPVTSPKKGNNGKQRWNESGSIPRATASLTFESRNDSICDTVSASTASKAVPAQGRKKTVRLSRDSTEMRPAHVPSIAFQNGEDATTATTHTSASRSVSNPSAHSQGNSIVSYDSNRSAYNDCSTTQFMEAGRDDLAFVDKVAFRIQDACPFNMNDYHDGAESFERNSLTEVRSASLEFSQTSLREREDREAAPLGTGEATASQELVNPPPGSLESQQPSSREQGDRDAAPPPQTDATTPSPALVQPAPASLKYQPSLPSLREQMDQCKGHLSKIASSAKVPDLCGRISDIGNKNLLVGGAATTSDPVNPPPVSLESQQPSSREQEDRDAAPPPQTDATTPSPALVQPAPASLKYQPSLPSLREQMDHCNGHLSNIASSANVPNLCGQGQISATGIKDLLVRGSTATASSQGSVDPPPVPVESQPESVDCPPPLERGKTNVAPIQTIASPLSRGIRQPFNDITPTASNKSACARANGKDLRFSPEFELVPEAVEEEGEALLDQGHTKSEQCPICSHELIHQYRKVAANELTTSNQGESTVDAVALKGFVDNAARNGSKAPIATTFTGFLTNLLVSGTTNAAKTSGDTAEAKGANNAIAEAANGSLLALPTNEEKDKPVPPYCTKCKSYIVSESTNQVSREEMLLNLSEWMNSDTSEDGDGGFATEKALERQNEGSRPFKGGIIVIPNEIDVDENSNKNDANQAPIEESDPAATDMNALATTNPLQLHARTNLVPSTETESEERKAIRPLPPFPRKEETHFQSHQEACATKQLPTSTDKGFQGQATDIDEKRSLQSRKETHFPSHRKSESGKEPSTENRVADRVCTDAAAHFDERSTVDRRNESLDEDRANPDVATNVDEYQKQIFQIGSVENEEAPSMHGSLSNDKSEESRDETDMEDSAMHRQHMNSQLDNGTHIEAQPDMNGSAITHRVCKSGSNDDTIRTGDEEAEMIANYPMKREIATKVIGSKLLKGYSLTAVQCAVCEMPMMERNNEYTCVVCPVIKRKAKKSAKQKREEQYKASTIFIADSREYVRAKDALDKGVDRCNEKMTREVEFIEFEHLDSARGADELDRQSHDLQKSAKQEREQKKASPISIANDRDHVKMLDTQEGDTYYHPRHNHREMATELNSIDMEEIDAARGADALEGQPYAITTAISEDAALMVALEEGVIEGPSFESAVDRSARHFDTAEHQHAVDSDRAICSEQHGGVQFFDYDKPPQKNVTSGLSEVCALPSEDMHGQKVDHEGNSEDTRNLDDILEDSITPFFNNIDHASKKLLIGWTLLQEPCAACGGPTMSEANAGSGHCCNKSCHLFEKSYFEDEGQGQTLPAADAVRDDASSDFSDFEDDPEVIALQKMMLSRPTGAGETVSDRDEDDQAMQPKVADLSLVSPTQSKGDNKDDTEKRSKDNSFQEEKTESAFVYSSQQTENDSMPHFNFEDPTLKKEQAKPRSPGHEIECDASSSCSSLSFAGKKPEMPHVTKAFSSSSDELDVAPSRSRPSISSPLNGSAKLNRGLRKHLDDSRHKYNGSPISQGSRTASTTKSATVIESMRSDLSDDTSMSALVEKMHEAKRRLLSRVQGGGSNVAADMEAQLDMAMLIQRLASAAKAVDELDNCVREQEDEAEIYS